MSITTTARQAHGMRVGEVIAKLRNQVEKHLGLCVMSD
jgi:hypothetical protein